MLIDPLRSESLHLEKLLPAFSKKKVKTKNGHDKLNFLRHTGIHPIDLTTKDDKKLFLYALRRNKI